MKNLQAQCFGGTTFHADNDIETRIKTGTVSIHGHFIVEQSNPYHAKEIFPPPFEQISSTLPHQLSESKMSHSSSQENLNAVSLPLTAVTYPSDFLEIPLPKKYMSNPKLRGRQLSLHRKASENALDPAPTKKIAQENKKSLNMTPLPKKKVKTGRKQNFGLTKLDLTSSESSERCLRHP